jgi:hypothetical protein
MRLSAYQLWGIGLAQAIFYTMVWMLNDYTATILSGIFILIALSVLIISFISDRLEYANVGSSYYLVLWISFLVPMMIGLLFWKIKGGTLDWMQSPL